MPLITPFGDIIVEMNGNPCAYSVKPLPNEIIGSQRVPFFKVEHRFKITPEITAPLSFPLKLKCRIEAILSIEDSSDLETGERYASVSMIHNGIKLSIGSYDEFDEVYVYENDAGIKVDGGLILNDFTTTGIEIFVREKQYWQYAFFCVAWSTLSGDDYTCNGEVDVWFAADPFMSE